MKELLEFIIEGLLGNKKFTINEKNEGDFVNLSIKVAPEDIGLIIGKEGKIIRSIRNILRIKATLEKKGFAVNIEE